MICVEDIMTRHPHTLGTSASLADARRLMAEFDVRHIPVVDEGGDLVGLVTHRDVLEASSSVLDDDEQERARHDSHIVLEEVMTTELDLVEPAASLREAALLMRNHRHGCLPVLSGDELVGIITDTDFVEVSIHLLEQIESSEPEEEDLPDEDDYLDEDDDLGDLPVGDFDTDDDW